MNSKIVLMNPGQLAKGVEFLAFPGADYGDEERAQGLCNCIVQVMEHYTASGVKGEARL